MKPTFHPLTKLVLILGITILAMVSCDLLTPNEPAGNTLFDAPFDELSDSQLQTHLVGDEEFEKIRTFDGGLGPMFIASSCDKCHPGEGKGPTLFNVTRFGRQTEDGYDQLEELGGPELQNRAKPGYEPEVLPEEANAVTELTPPSVTGLGYLEEVPDSTLLSMADPNDVNGDGISGRVQLIDSTDFIADISNLGSLLDADPNDRMRIDGKIIGRFGKKGVTINLFHQVHRAFNEDMGLTTPLVPHDLLNKQQGLETDDVADPEISPEIIKTITFYLQTLRPPKRRNAEDVAVMAGKQVFKEIQCASCHKPTLKTGSSDIAALDNKEFHPYSDLLLHDMGAKLDDGYREGRAKGSEWRTPPLWGLGLADKFQSGMRLLHDGRAKSIREAIKYHGGEASQVRQNFSNLSQDKQEQLIKFLKSL